MRTRKPTIGWVLYDYATVIFGMAVAGVYFPLWIVDDRDGSDSQVAIALSLAMAFVLVCSPILGSYAERTSSRVRLLTISTVLCAIITFTIGQDNLTLALILFTIAHALNGIGFVFYDSLLPIVSTPATRGRISGFGIGAGFAGALTGVLIGVIVLAGDDTNKPLVFRIVAIAFLLAAIPCLIWVREPPPPAQHARVSIRDDLRTTWRLTRSLPGLSRFLAGRVLYTDAANTTFAFMSVYAVKEIGFSETTTQFVLLLGVLGGPVGALWAGKSVDRNGPKVTLDRVLWIWVGVLVLCAAIPLFDLPPLLFWLVAPCGGFAFGGCGTADRALLLTLTPPDQFGRFFGVFTMVGRFSSIAGPLIWALTVDVLDLGRPAAVLTLAAMVLVTLRAFTTLPVQEEGTVTSGLALSTSSD